MLLAPAGFVAAGPEAASEPHMVLISVGLLFLVIGAWEHGRKLAIVLFLGFLLLGVLDLRRDEPYPAGPFITFDPSALLALME